MGPLSCVERWEVGLGGPVLSKKGEPSHLLNSSSGPHLTTKGPFPRTLDKGTRDGTRLLVGPSGTVDPPTVLRPPLHTDTSFRSVFPDRSECRVGQFPRRLTKATETL